MHFSPDTAQRAGRTALLGLICASVIWVSAGGTAEAQGIEERSVNQPPDRGLIVDVRGLNKVSGQMATLEVKTGEPIRFGRLVISAYTCTKAPPEELPESTAFLQIDEIRDKATARPSATDNAGAFQQPGMNDGLITPEEELNRIFSGWMFASSPALNALEHPVYDVWVTNCRTSDGGASTQSR